MGTHVTFIAAERNLGSSIFRFRNHLFGEVFPPLSSEHAAAANNASKKLSVRKLAREIESLPFQHYISYAIGVMILATLPLWFAVETVPPRVPIIDGFGLPPSWFLVAVAFIAIGPLFRKRWAWSVATIAFIAVFLSDQLALQPWAYQFAIYAALFALAGVNQIRWHRVVAISIYFYSGLGKLDYQFAHTVGADFLSTMTLGSSDDWSAPVVAKLVLLLPVAEISTAVLLAYRPTRRIGALVVVALHCSLLAVLGPWGLDHSTGVLAWNLILIGQAYYLFWRDDTAIVSDKSIRTLPLAWALTLVVTLGPLSERSGYWDHWLAWSVYAPHTSRVECQVSALATANPSLANFIDPKQDGDRWRRLDLAQMSLVNRSVPIYPQARYQLQLVADLAEQYSIGDNVRVVVRGTADRWTGKRTETYLLGLRQIQRFAQQRSNHQ